MSYQELLDSLDDYYQLGFDVLKSYRDQGKVDIPAAKFFRKWYGDEAYEIWASTKFIREDVYHNGTRSRHAKLWIYANGELVDPSGYDVSDFKYNSLTKKQKAKFEERERLRRIFGIWTDIPSVLKKYEGREHELRTVRKHSPFFGKVQLIPGSYYFLLMYLPQDLAKGESPGTYNRKSNQLHSILEILDRYKPAPGQNRQGLLTVKPRGTKYTSDRNARKLNRLTLPFYASEATIINSQENVSMEINKLLNPYEKTPSWFRDSLCDDDVKYTHKLEAGGSSIKTGYFNVKNPETGQVTKNKYSVYIAKPQHTEGRRLTAVDFEEVGLYNYDLTSLKQKARDTMKFDSPIIQGVLTMGGVIDQDNQNREVLKQHINRPADYEVFAFFIGKQHHKYVDPETGWANEELCIQEEEEVIRRYRENGQLRDMALHKIQSAISVRDCFFSSGQARIDTARFGLHMGAIERETESGELNQSRGWFDWGDDNSPYPIWRPDPKGGWLIQNDVFPNQPRDRNLIVKTDYIQGSDNFNKTVDAEQAEEAMRGIGKWSQWANVIMNVNTEEVVARYKYRHPDPRDDADQSLLASLYFQCYTFPETNKELQLNYFWDYENPDRGLTRGKTAKLLLPTPRRYLTSRNRARPYGMPTSRNKLSLYEQYITPYLDENLEKIPFYDLLEDLYDWDIETNKDTPDGGMAMLFALIGMKELQQNPPKQSRGPGNMIKLQEAVSSFRRK